MKTNTHLIFILSFILVLAAGGTAFFMHTQMDKKIEIVKNYYIKEKQNSSFEFGSNLDIKSNVLFSQEAIIRNTFLDSNSIVNFVQNIERIGQNNALEILVEKIEPGEKQKITEGQFVHSGNFYINTTGSYRNIKNFVEQVQNLETIVNVAEFKLYKNDLENSNTVYNARIVLSTHIFTYEKN